MKATDSEEAATLSHLLNRVARLYSARVVDELQAKPRLGELRPVHLVTMMQLGKDGKRITSIADDLDVSKQAVKRVVDELEELGHTERMPDPSDRRAKLVKLTTKGKRACSAGIDIVHKVEAHFADEAGGDTMSRLWRDLNVLAEWLEDRGGQASSVSA